MIYIYTTAIVEKARCGDSNMKCKEETFMKNKKTILCMLLTLLLVCASLSGCGNEKSPTPAGTYVMQGAAEAFLAPHITFDPEDSSFSFAYDLLLSYLPHGTYTVSDGKLRAATEDGKFVYIFEVVDDATIRFVQSGSSPTTTVSGGLAVSDGAEFKLKEDVNNQ